MPASGAGPSADAQWLRNEERDGVGQATLSLLDARTDRKCLHALPDAPRLARDGSGNPVLSLVLLLSRDPAPGRDRLDSLIQGGQLTFDVDLALDAAQLERLGRRHGAEVVPLFAREVRYLLFDSPDDPPWAEAAAAGAGARASLAARLGREQSLELLAVLAGDTTTPDAAAARESPARVRAVIAYRTAAQRRSVRLSGNWATLYDYLVTALHGGAGDRQALRGATQGMMAAGLLSATADGGAGGGEPLPFDDALFDTFLRLAAIILEPDPLGGDRYRLRRRPHDAFPLAYREHRPVSRRATLTLEASLADVLTGAMRDRPLDAHVRLVTLSPRALASRDVPRSVRAVPRDERGPPGAAAKLGLIAHAGTLHAAHEAVLPKVRPNPVARPSSLVRPSLLGAAGQRPGLTLHGDYVLELPDRQRPRSLPVIARERDPLWPDRNDARLRWYAPTFELVLPDASATSDASAFLFTYRRVGATGGGAPAIEARVHFTLRRGMSGAVGSAAAEAARHGLRVREVALSELAVSLELPFVDAGSGAATSDRFDAEVEEDGDALRVIVELRNDWARLCYGALAEEGFQATPVRLRVGYAFEAYVPVKSADLEIRAGGKTRGVPVDYGGAEAAAVRPAGAVFDARTLTLAQPGATLRLQREQLTPSPSPTRAGASVTTAAAVTAERRSAPSRDAVATLTARPPLKVAPSLSALLAKVGHAHRSVSRVEEIPALLPCRRYGELYRERIGGGEASTAIGCRDALKLGETTFRQYEELPELAAPSYRVYRSLQQPGQFLVVAAHYHLTRIEEDGEVRPGIMLYALLDAEDAADVRITLDATLQPALAPYVRRDLLRRLEAYAAQPRLMHPTELGLRTLRVDWGLDPGVDVTTLASGPFLRASFGAGPAEWLLLRTRLEAAGLLGSATFTLPDGTTLVSNLQLRLDTLAGPWDSGAVEATITGRQAELHNRSEAPADVHELALYGPDARTSVEARLAPGQRLSVPLEHAHSEAYAVFTLPQGDPVTITEVRAFIENLDQSVAFVGLVDLPARGLAALDVEARLAGVEGTYRGRITPDLSVAELRLLMPLTAYLEDPTLQYRVTKLFTDDRAETTAWLEAALADSAIIDLTWERIA